MAHHRGVIPSKYQEAIEEGIKEAAKKGVLAGFPVMGFKAIVYNGSYHEVDSSDLAFQIAASLAFKKVMAEAHPVLLEPIYRLKVLAPQERVGTSSPTSRPGGGGFWAWSRRGP